MAAFLRRLAGGDPGVDPMVNAAELDGRTPADYDDAVTLNGRTPADYDNAVTLNGRTPADYDDAVTLDGRTAEDFDDAVTVGNRGPGALLPQVAAGGTTSAVTVTGTSGATATTVASVVLPGDANRWVVNFNAMADTSHDQARLSCQINDSALPVAVMTNLFIGDNSVGYSDRVHFGGTFQITTPGTMAIKCYVTDIVGSGVMTVVAPTLIAHEVTV
jgi:hypothetical protein